ncbi:siroheme synthase-like protein [Pedobacter sp. CG_S7]|uniref:precorrin-2 dehydrogenase/sirohydrochlorin ferrochelatase family protein n=1 Tax=Pedobacter sp. CG_S7 TaxID=3143930 RepID=UPI0033935481
MEGNELFPVFIKLNTLHTLLVGAGPVGLEKLTALITNSPRAKITIVALKVLPEVSELANRSLNVVIYQKAFHEEDLDDIDLVFAATNNDELNEQIRTFAKKKKLLANFADKPALCDFYLGSIVKKGDLKIGISTNGKSPTIAKRLKEILNESLPEEINTSLQQMSKLRNRLEGDFTDKVIRLNQVTSILVDNEQNHPLAERIVANIKAKITVKYVMLSLGILLTLVSLCFIFSLI